MSLLCPPHRIDVTEVQVLIIVMHLLAAIGGHAFWQAPVIGSLPFFTRASVMSTIQNLIEHSLDLCAWTIKSLLNVDFDLYVAQFECPKSTCINPVLPFPLGSVKSILILVKT